MWYNKNMIKRGLFIGVLCCFLGLSSPSYAGNAVIEAIIGFVMPGGIFKHADISFGDIGVSNLPTSNGEVRLHPDGSIDTDIPEMTLSGGHNAGHVEFFQAAGDIEVRCSDAVFLANDNGDTVRISEVRIAFPAPAAWGVSSVCNGIAGAPAGAYDLTADPDPTLSIYIGARLEFDGANPLDDIGAYNSSNAGGEMIELEITLL